MATIGDIDIDVWQGILLPAKPRTKVVQTAGIDGYGAQTQGLGDNESDITTICFFASDASPTARQFMDNCAAMLGTVADVTDGYGDTYSKVFISGVDIGQNGGQGGRKRVAYKGDPMSDRVVVYWKMIRSDGEGDSGGGDS